VSTKFVIDRLIQALLTILLLSLIVFGLARLTGDPVNLMVPMDASPRDIANIRASLGLDSSLPVQYWHFVTNALRGDFGRSIKWDRPAVEMLLEHFPATIILSLTSMAFGLLLALPVASGRR